MTPADHDVVDRDTVAGVGALERDPFHVEETDGGLEGVAGIAVEILDRPRAAGRGLVGHAGGDRQYRGQQDAGRPSEAMVSHGYSPLAGSIRRLRRTRCGIAPGIRVDHGVKSPRRGQIAGANVLSHGPHIVPGRSTVGNRCGLVTSS